MPEGKASGEDGISTEVIKRCELNDIILDNALITEEILRQCTILSIIYLMEEEIHVNSEHAKTESLGLGGIYRGFSFIIEKAFSKMILNRIKSAIDHRLHVYQNGFRRGITTRSLLCEHS